MKQKKEDKTPSIINAVCNIILTAVVTAASSFMVWWLMQILYLYSEFD